VSDVVTGEAVPLDLRLAALPSRAAAAMIDVAVQLAVVFLFTLLLSGLQISLDRALQATFAVVVTVGILVGYPVAAETLWRGRTLGKAALGLRVVRDDGGPIRFRQALVRGLVGGIVEKPGVLLFTVIISVISAVLSRRGKRLGDVLAGTVVLQERVPVRGGPVATMPPALARWAATLDLSGLSDDLALAVRQFLARAGQLEPHAREQLGGQLAHAVSAAVRPPPPPGTTGWQYLSAVLAERRRREEERLRRQGAMDQSPPRPLVAGAPPLGPATMSGISLPPAPAEVRRAVDGFVPPT